MIDLSKVKEIESGISNARRIAWNATRWCNYHCSYCLQGQKKNKMPNLLTIIEEAKIYRKKIDELNKRYPKAYENLLVEGGEVGFYDLPKLISPMLSSRTISITLISNLSAPIGNYKALSQFIDKKNGKPNRQVYDKQGYSRQASNKQMPSRQRNRINLSFNFSFHEEFTTTKEFFKKVEAIKSFAQCINIQFTVTDKNVHLLQEVIRYTRALDVKLHLAIARTRLKGEEDYCSKETVAIVQKYQDKRGGIRVTYDDGKKVFCSRAEVANNKKGICNFKGYLCTNRLGSIRIECGKIVTDCHEDIASAKDKCICTKERCSLCGNMHVVKVEVDKTKKTNKTENNGGAKL